MRNEVASEADIRLTLDCAQKNASGPKEAFLLPTVTVRQAEPEQIIAQVVQLFPLHEAHAL